LIDGTARSTIRFLQAGTHTITAKATDPAGNVSAVSTGLSLTIDTSAPSAPVGLILSPGSDSGAVGDNLTNVALPTISGTGVEAGATITLLDGGATIGTGKVVGGAWSITASTALTAGVNTIAAIQTDVAGNASAASTPLIVTLDTVALAPASLALGRDDISHFAA
jgi:large repetitive protein